MPGCNGKIYQYPISRESKQVIGNPLVTNIMSLGIIVQLTNIVSKDALKKAINARIPQRVKDINQKALEYGFNVAKKLEI